MTKHVIRIVIIAVVSLFVAATSYSSSWVESSQGGMSIRHPKDWHAVWKEDGVAVAHSGNPMIWCAFSTAQWQGSAQQLIDTLLQNYQDNLENLRILEKKQVSKKPDTYGARFVFHQKGIRMGSLILATTEDRKYITIRNYAAPIESYDEMKLLFIPILLSVKFEHAGVAGGASSGSSPLTQVLGSPNGYWRMKTPRGWKSINMGQDESIAALCVSPKGEAVGVNFLCGLARFRALRMRMSGGTAPPTSIPYLPASELFRNVLFPYYQTEKPNLQLKNIQPLDQGKAQYSVTYTGPQGTGTMAEEGVVINNSLPDLYGGDFNVYSRYWVAAPEQHFGGVKKQLWQIIQTFEPSPYFGAAVMQILMQMRQETQQTMQNMVMNTIRTNHRMMQQTMQTTMGIMQDRRHEGAGWSQALSSEDMVRDPDTGTQYSIPVGGEYIYGKQSGPGQIDVIRSDAPLTAGDLPLGFRAFEQLPIGEVSK
jgi:hypothetical protein